jgi:hypothetical protein
VRNGEIVIIDEFTGRMMPGRRYSEGLHQALEAKEHVAIQPENQTLASVTFQNYFRMYKKLSGMTGTALTEAEEFANIYGLEVTEVPTNLPVKRLDEDDEVYRTVEEKYKAIIRDIKEAREKGPPPRARGGDRRPGRQARRHHHRHQHGRTRHRHSARRQRRHAHRRGACRNARGPRARRQGSRDPR